jgi:hypothetical protein
MWARSMLWVLVCWMNASVCETAYNQVIPLWFWHHIELSLQSVRGPHAALLTVCFLGLVPSGFLLNQVSSVHVMRHSV